MIGNGFDLFCGLKTKYSDFFDKASIDDIKNWCEELKRNKRFLEYLDYSISNHEDFAPTIKLSERITIWDLFFYLVSKKKKEEILWCDVEDEIRKSLRTQGKNKYVKSVLWDNVLEIIFTFIYERGNYLDYTYEELLCASFLKNKFSKKLDELMFYNYLLKELKKFEKRFGEYVKKQMEDEKYKNNVKKTIEKLVSIKRNNQLSIYSFNYTCFFPKEFFVNNINGVLKEPIFGIDSSSINNIDEKYIFTMTYRRMEYSLKNNIIKEEAPFENIVIFGHSLNEQDYNYFFPLFNRLKITEQEFKGKIVFAYYIYDESKKHEIEQKLMINVSRMFERYENYINPKSENRLLEILSFNNSIIYYKIDAN